VLDILANHVRLLRVHSDTLGDFERYRLPYVRQAEARPESVAERSFRGALFRGHLYSHNDEIPNDKLPDLDEANRWLATVLNPRGATLAIAGNIDPTEAASLARRSFDGWSAGSGVSDPPPLLETGTAAVVVTHRPLASQAVLQLGCRLPAATAESTVARDVLSDAVSLHFASLREQKGIDYSLTASTRTLRGGTAVLYLEGAIENAGLASALSTIRTDLQGADWHHDLDRGRWAVARQYNLGLASARQWVERALILGRHGWDLSTADDVPRLLVSLDEGAMVASLRRCSSEGVLSLVGDEPAVRAALAKGWELATRLPGSD
jgi:predicted Zn-dependent peptidase